MAHLALARAPGLGGADESAPVGRRGRARDRADEALMISEEFKSVVQAAIDQALVVPDDAVRYMARTIPIYLDQAATPEQGAAAGCPGCQFLGLWADRWAGYPTEPHGTIWLFERGIQSLPGDKLNNVFDVLVHEMSHALQRDHVIDAMEAEARGEVAQPRGCGCPGGSPTYP